MLVPLGNSEALLPSFNYSTLIYKYRETIKHEVGRKGAALIMVIINY